MSRLNHPDSSEDTELTDDALDTDDDLYMDTEGIDSIDDDDDDDDDEAVDEPTAEELAGQTEYLLSCAVDHLGGARREGQVTMAQEVARHICRRRHLAVQAGTGTGKSLAYLIPAIAYAVRTGTTVVVSTATLALQRQLVSRDLPRLVEALEPELGEINYTILKGRSNYVCLNKLAAADAEPDSLLGDEEQRLSVVARQVLQLRQWAEDTETGDRDDVDFPLTDLAWRQMSVTAKECIGSRSCAYGEDCFAEHARREAHDAHVVVTNHAMLAIDALSDNSVLPEHAIVIVDEAHELDGRITAMASEELYAPGMQATCRRVTKFDSSAADELKSAIDDWEDFFTTTTPAGRWSTLPPEAPQQLELLKNSLWSAFSDVKNASVAADDTEQLAERRAVATALNEAHDTVVRILAYGEKMDAGEISPDVVWREQTWNAPDKNRLMVAPLKVADLLRDHLFKDSTTILTSATLALGGKFDAMAASWGLEKNHYTALDVGTPFDPQKSGILYCARHLPPPSQSGLHEGQLDEIVELVKAAGGRTLGLFSSRKAADQATAHVREHVEFPVLCQGDDTLGALVNEFASDAQTCLFGTLGLWQGVDVPGPNLSLVIIDRIPFPRPDDPLLQARKEAADAQGRSGFIEVAGNHAALLLAQGAGRLLRSTTDRGVVAILDSRLATRRYGTYLRRSMPPMYLSANLDQVVGALGRLTADLPDTATND